MVATKPPPHSNRARRPLRRPRVLLLDELSALARRRSAASVGTPRASDRRRREWRVSRRERGRRASAAHTRRRHGRGDEGLPPGMVAVANYGQATAWRGECHGKRQRRRSEAWPPTVGSTSAAVVVDARQPCALPARAIMAPQWTTAPSPCARRRSSPPTCSPRSACSSRSPSSARRSRCSGSWPSAARTIGADVSAILRRCGRFSVSLSASRRTVGGVRTVRAAFGEPPRVDILSLLELVRAGSDVADRQRGKDRQLGGSAAAGAGGAITPARSNGSTVPATARDRRLPWRTHS